MILKIQEDVDGYPQFEALIKARIETNKEQLFTVSTENLFSHYFLGNLDGYRRQHYNCRCCKQFFDRYGGLVTIDENGKKHSLLWNVSGVPEFFKNAVRHLRKMVENRSITNMFISSEQMFGHPETGEWTHFHGRNPKVVLNPLKNSHQLMAEKLEDFDILHRSLLEFPLQTAEEAVRVISRLNRSEKALDCAHWFVNLHEDVKAADNKNHFNVIWKYVGNAPAGWCHIRSSMIGTVLEQLKAGMSFGKIEVSWNAKMDPLKYQRPTTVKAGNIDAAETAFQKLGAQSALPRRFAELGDIKKLIWQPSVPRPKKVLFGSVRPSSGIPSLKLRQSVMTWEKFQRTVLKDAEKLEFLATPKGNYYSLVTAVDPNSYPMLQWDSWEYRNQLSHYVYVGGSNASNWNLMAGSWVKVNGLCMSPPQQSPGNFKNHADRVMVVLDRCFDINYRVGGLYFPEDLKNELREFRSVIEAYSNNNSISGRGSAHGYMFSEGQNYGDTVVFRVNGVDEYKIDRWD